MAIADFHHGVRVTELTEGTNRIRVVSMATSRGRCNQRIDGPSMKHAYLQQGRATARTGHCG